MEERRTCCGAGSVPLSRLLVGGLVGLLAGCHTLKFMPSVADRPEKPEKEALATVPPKRSLRVGQFVFHSDFELKRHSPLFRELLDFREQVYRELQLPRCDTP